MGKNKPRKENEGTDTQEKKKRKKKFKSIKEFANKLEYFDYMIKYWQDKKEDYQKNGDGSKKKAVKRAKKLAENIEKLMKSDPDAARILLEAVKGKQDKKEEGSTK